MGKRVIVVGGGIAGMQTALKLSAGGVSALLLECDADLGGKLTGWHKLFPSFTPAHEVLDELRRRLAASDVEVRKGYYRELMEIYMEDVPSVAMYAVINAIAHSNQLVMEDANIYQMARVHWAE